MKTENRYKNKSFHHIGKDSSESSHIGLDDHLKNVPSADKSS